MSKTKIPEEKPKKEEQMQRREITTELRESYLAYAMSVIVSRALPDVRDGLKPVQRRILWSAWETGLNHTSKFRKSANVVGGVMAHYHPHGDIPIYDAMARMAQSFSLRYPLVNGQGNWGSIDGDAPAAMRYCVTGDTLIVTDRGLKPIEKISENNAEDIDVKILSRNRAIHKAEKWFDSGEHPTIRIKTSYGFELAGTANHPILTWEKDFLTGEPRFAWKLLENLREGDIAVVERTHDLLWPEEKINLIPYWPKENRRWEKKMLPRELDENMAFILGALVAEGTIKENEIEFCNSDQEFIEAFSTRWKEAFPDCRLHLFHRAPNSFGKKPYNTLEIHSREVVALLRAIGLEPVKSAAKRIPHLILQSPKSVVAAFLEAYFEGDGSVSTSGRMNELSAVSISETLLKELQIVLLRFGIASAKRFDRFRNTHKLYIRGYKNYLLFRDYIGFAGRVKKGKLETMISALVKDFSQTDFIPFLSNFVKTNARSGSKNERITGHYNCDRYSNLERRTSIVLTALQDDVQNKTSRLFEMLLSNNYLFDPVVYIAEGGVKRVYSLRVASDCHSFIGNGFVNHNTEAKLAKITSELLVDIEKETVDWDPNYDNTRKEPRFLPARLPNLLLNGTMGIAVGMATSIPPHNLCELVDGIIHFSENPDATTADLMKFIPGPDFPTGGIIYDRKAVEEAYATGKGSVTMRAVAQIEERKSGSFQIVITEIPYQVNKSTLVMKIAELVTDKKIEGIRDLRDESDRDGLRIIVELRQDASPQKILNQLYQYTELQKNFYFNVLALVDGIQPQVLSLKDVLSAYIDHRKIIVQRRTEFDLKKAEERAHILEGLVKALGVIDKIIATIKRSKDKEDAGKNLIKNFKLTAIQAQAILEMRLQTLAALERKKLDDELTEKRKIIKELEFILKHPKKIVGIIQDELVALKKDFPEPRRTKVVSSSLTEFREEDLIPNEEAVITLTRDGYIKRMPPSTFRSQKRGGKGLIGFELKEEDMIEQFISAETHDNALFFTDQGRVFQTKVYEIPVASRTAKGKSIHNYLEIPPTERVSAVISYSNATKKSLTNFLVMATKDGNIKKTSLSDFANVRRNGIIAIKLKKGDVLRWVDVSSGKDEVILSTAFGQAIRFKEKDIRSMSRAASGVRGINLKKSDNVAGLDIIRIGEGAPDLKKLRLLAVMANGFGKQTPLSEYKVQHRGGSGIKTAKVTEKTGQVIAARVIDDSTEELLAFSKKGQAIKIKLKDVRIASRDTQGVRVMNLEKEDALVGIVCS